VTGLQAAGDESKVVQTAESKLDAKKADVERCTFFSLSTHLLISDRNLNPSDTDLITLAADVTSAPRH
jgi:hypothetical protein